MAEPNLRERVEAALREHAAPALALDGTGIEVVAVEDGIASVRLSGACAGCPATISTILFGLEHELRKHVDGVEFLEVVP